MVILKTYQTKNRCYQKGQSASHVGILVHSTGANNKNLSRYVDAPDLVGKNKYNNTWNTPDIDKCVHAFLGCDKDGNLAVAQTLPFEYACWGCGKGKNGSYNRDPVAHIQFEICQGSNTDSAYYWKAIALAVDFCAYLCRLYGFTAANICSHREAAVAGYASNHGDPESWMKYFGDDMDKFRSRVAEALGQTAPTSPEVVTPPTTPSEPSGKLGERTLKKTSPYMQGDDVRELQTRLNDLGFDSGKVDGKFGANTKSAVEDFQRAKGLKVDGIFGPDTFAALISAGTVHPPDPEPEPETSEDIYTTVQGDTLWGIAQRYLGSGNKFPQIMTANGLTSTLIRPGMKLKIPG